MLPRRGTGVAANRMSRPWNEVKSERWRRRLVSVLAYRALWLWADEWNAKQRAKVEDDGPRYPEE